MHCYLYVYLVLYECGCLASGSARAPLRAAFFLSFPLLQRGALAPEDPRCTGEGVPLLRHPAEQLRTCNCRAADMVRLNTVLPGAHMTRRFLNERDRVLYGMGELLFPSATQTKRVAEHVGYNSPVRTNLIRCTRSARRRLSHKRCTSGHEHPATHKHSGSRSNEMPGPL